MTQPNNKITNPLLNNAVTGGTFEDFSQNALLLPAKEKPPNPVVIPPPTEHPFLPEHEPHQQYVNPPLDPISFFQPTIQQTPHDHSIFFQPNTDPIQEIEPPQPEIQDNKNIFSSFSNILKLLPNQQQNQQGIDEPVPLPAGIGQFMTNEPGTSGNIEPIPLFPSAGLQPQTKVESPPQGPVNTFRRAGISKRPVYAPLPGLSSASPQPPTYQPQNQPPVNFFNPPQASSSSFLTEFIPTENPSPALSTGSTHDTYPPQNHFNPISPQPPTFFNPVVPKSHEVIPNQASNLSFGSNFQSPVMAAIPVAEVLQDGEVNGLASSNSVNSSTSLNNRIFRPVYHHWFYKREVEGKVLWQPFSMVDSLALDEAFTSNELNPEKAVATDGGRYDVNILRRERVPVYWKGAATEVRRCSWFHKGNSDGRYVPYEENISTKLEAEYKIAFEADQWHRKVELANAETVVFHAHDVLVLFPPTQSPDAWGNTPNQLRPRMVKRGMDEFDIDEGEPSKVDHVLFMVHGIGSVCDLKFRTVEEVVDDFRSISLQLVQSHYKSSCDRGKASRIEVLPISWHDELHSEETDKKLKSITLTSIPRLRDFTNDTLLDVLFYTSPTYGQTIVSTVGNQLNRIYALFRQRNPDFGGGVSLSGHSLGSLILFDLLCHQHPEAGAGADAGRVGPLRPEAPLERQISRRISYMMAKTGTGQPQISYPHLDFQPAAFFALGSPIGMFVTIRGLNNLGERFALPTCPAFFNIFHPYDPVAYRIESLVNPDLAGLKPVLIPHHKGRKRMHLELKETMARVGADLKQKVVESMKSTWNSFYQLAMFHRPEQPSLEEEVDRAFKRQMEEDEESEEPEEQATDLPLGALNKGRRVDYVLQEAPFEFFNEYIFALTSHVGYWDSEDTILLILKEIYSGMEVATDDKIPQQSMTIERAPATPAGGEQGGVVGPPPIGGFVRKT